MDLNSTPPKKIPLFGCRFSYQTKCLGKLKFGSSICSAMRCKFGSQVIYLSTPYFTLQSVQLKFNSALENLEFTQNPMPGLSAGS